MKVSLEFIPSAGCKEKTEEKTLDFGKECAAPCYHLYLALLSSVFFGKPCLLSLFILSVELSTITETVLQGIMGSGRTTEEAPTVRNTTLQAWDGWIRKEA